MTPMLAVPVALAAARRQPLRPPQRHSRIPHFIRLPTDLLHQLGQSGPLESPWLAAGFGVLLAASVAVVAWQAVRRRRSGRRPRHRRLRRVVVGAWLGLLTLLTTLAALNAYVGYVPTLPGLFGSLPGDPVGSRVSHVEVLRIGDPALDVPPSATYVYLPPGYQAAGNAKRRYPVVYLLHGYPGGPIDWFRAAEIREVMDALLRYRLVQPMILVAPDASGGWLHDSEMLNQVGGPQVETYLTRTVVAAIDARYRTIADRSGRAIGGMSSGGYGALNLGLRHQDVYAVSLAEMPYGDPGDVQHSLLGGSRALWLANAPSHYLPHLRFTEPMAVFLTAGSHDPTLAEARSLGAMLARRGQLVEVKEVPGATHSWHGARVEAPYALAFASQHLGTAPTAARPTRARPVAAHRLTALSSAGWYNTDPPMSPSMEVVAHAPGVASAR